jgi:Zn-dependent peptidase ImmA (M78 family)
LLQPFPFTYGYVQNLGPEDDAVTQYIPEYDLHLIHINESKVNYPFQCSNDRRLNFTLAHELAHILLGHTLIPRHLKTGEEIELEEIEADELAGRLLMPRSLLFSINYHSIDIAAEYFMVSKIALWKRLNNLKRLDLLRSRNINSCKNCRNTYFSLFSEYCEMCGKPTYFYEKGLLNSWDALLREQKFT